MEAEGGMLRLRWLLKVEKGRTMVVSASVGVMGAMVVLMVVAVVVGLILISEILMLDTMFVVTVFAMGDHKRKNQLKQAKASKDSSLRP